MTTWSSKWHSTLSPWIQASRARWTQPIPWDFIYPEAWEVFWKPRLLLPQGNLGRMFYAQAAGGSELSEKPVKVLDTLPRSAQGYTQHVPAFLFQEIFWSQRLTMEPIDQLCYKQRALQWDCWGQAGKRDSLSWACREWTMALSLTRPWSYWCLLTAVPSTLLLYSLTESEGARAHPEFRQASWIVARSGVTMPETLQWAHLSPQHSAGVKDKRGGMTRGPRT